MIVIGCISGTSMDGIDVSAGEFTGAGTDELTLRPMVSTTVPWSESLRERLLAVLPPAPCTAEEVCRLDVLAGEEIAAVVRQVIDHHAPDARLVVSHGQTVHHWVEDSVARGGLQLGQPAAIVEATGLPVVSDVRSRDIAAGGQGAPLAGTLDSLLLRDAADGRARAALNLGGIANVSVVGPEGEVAFDTGPASCLIDAVVQQLSGGAQACDVDGERAARGSVITPLLDHLLADPYYALPAPKSTGRERFHRAYVDDALRLVGPIADDDLIATLTELTAVTVAAALRPYAVAQVFGSGGGMRNPTLTRRLAHHLAPATLHTIDELGLPSDGKEAYLMALIGYLTWHGIPGVVPGLTGARSARVLGRISPGDMPLRLPEPCRPPRSLHVETPRSATF